MSALTRIKNIDRGVFIVVGFAVLFLFPLLHPNVAVGDDLAFHIGRFNSIAAGLKDGQLLPQLDPSRLDGMGYAINMNYPPLSAYAYTVLAFVLQSDVLAYFALIFAVVLLAGLSMFAFIKGVTRNSTIATISALTFMSTPYFVHDLFMRAAVGEYTALAFSPLLMLGLYKLVHNMPSVPYIVAGAMGICLSHTLSVFLFGILALLYLLVNIKKMFNFALIKKLILAVFISFGLCAFYLLPFLDLYRSSNYLFTEPWFQMNAKSMSADSLNVSAQPIQLVVANWVSNHYVIGVFMAFVTALAIFGLSRIESKYRAFVVFFLATAVFSAICTTNVVNWQLAPSIFASLQFPSRLLSITAVSFSAISGIVLYYCIFTRFKKLKQTVFIAIVAVILVLNVMPTPLEYFVNLNVQESRGISMTTEVVKQNTDLGVAEGDVIPKSFSNDYLTLFDDIHALEKVPVAKNATLNKYSHTGSHYDIDTKTTDNSYVVLPQFYYPGYYAYYTQKGSDINLEVSASDSGLVQIKLPDNENLIVHSGFSMSLMTLIGLWITFITALGLVCYKFYRVTLGHEL